MSPSRASRVRWKILALLVGFSFVSYLQRMNISVASAFMMPELDLSEQQMGWVFSSFMIGYTICQIPAGWIGDRFGAWRVLWGSAIFWGALTILSGLVPGLLIPGGFAALVSLLVLRFLLGVVEAPTYPVAARAVANWFPSNGRAFPLALLIGGLSIGSTFTPPLISSLMVTVGWRKAFFVASGFAFLIAMLYRWYATERPEEHRSVTAGELAIISEGKEEGAASEPAAGNPWSLFRNKNIFLLSMSYFCYGYVFYIFVFWFFLYLTDVRGFTILESGFLTSLPFIVGGIAAPVGGHITDRLSVRIGRRWGRRWMGLIGMTLSGVALLIGANTEHVVLAIVALALCFGFGELTEGAYWSSIVDVSGRYAGSASGVMNMWTNLGGVICTPLVPLLVGWFGWPFALGSAAVVSWIAALLWLGIRSDETFEG